MIVLFLWIGMCFRRTKAQKSGPLYKSANGNSNAFRCQWLSVDVDFRVSQKADSFRTAFMTSLDYAFESLLLTLVFTAFCLQLHVNYVSITGVTSLTLNLPSRNNTRVPTTNTLFDCSKNLQDNK